MRKVLVFAIAADCLCGLWGCALVKDSDGLSSDPVFNVSYQIDSQYYNTVAGQDGIYLFTSSGLTPDEVWQYSGSFSSDYCPTADCPGTLTFRWRNNGIGDDFDSTYLPAGVYLTYRYFRSGLPEPEYYQAHFDCSPDSSSQYRAAWTLDGAPVGNDEFHFSRDLQDLAPMDVSCTLLHESGFSGRITQQYSDYSSSDFPFLVQLRAEARPDSGVILLAAKTLPSGLYSYNWNTGASSAETYVPTDPGASYRVTVTDPAGNTAVAELINPPSAPGPAYPISIGYLTASVDPVLTAKQGGFLIDWIDPQGTVWRSDLGDQYNQGHYFRVLDAQPYLPNENGQPTLLLNVEWKCLLYNSDGASRAISGSGVIALAWWQ